MAYRTQFGMWEKLESRGKGGQGEVFRARKINAQRKAPISTLADAIRQCAGYNASGRQEAANDIVSLIREIARDAVIQAYAQVGALKVLHERPQRRPRPECRQSLRH